MEDPVLAEAHRMTSRPYRKSKEVSRLTILFIIYYMIAQREGGDSLLPFGSLLNPFFTALLLEITNLIRNNTILMMKLVAFTVGRYSLMLHFRS